jgi:LysR family transcriptional regulator, transcriptional activator of nhaA
MNPWINYHHLFYFKIVAETGSLVKASEQLRVGKSALSMQIKILEDTLGQQLFERTQRKLIITQAGLTVLQYAQDIFRTGQELLDLLQDEHTGQKLKLQLGVHSSVPKNMASQIIDFLYQKRPNLSIKVTSGVMSTLLTDLENYKLDFIIANHLPRHQQSNILFAQRIFRHKVGLYAAPRFQYLQTKFPKMLSEAPFLLPIAQSTIRAEIEHYFEKHQIKINCVGEFEDSALEKYMAIQGAGVMAILPPAVIDYIQQKKLICLGEIPVYDEIWLIALKRKKQHSLWDVITKEFKFPE